MSDQQVMEFGNALPSAVYRFFDAEDRLLYVGSTGNLQTRMAAHERKAWWPEVAKTTVQWVATRAEAYEVEAGAIRNEQPLYNRDRNPVVPGTAKRAAGQSPSQAKPPPGESQAGGPRAIYPELATDLAITTQFAAYCVRCFGNKIGEFLRADAYAALLDHVAFRFDPDCGPLPPGDLAYLAHLGEGRPS